MAVVLDGVNEFPENLMASIEECLKEENFEDYKLKISRATVKGDNYLGDIFRVVAEGKKDNGTENSINFVVKTASLIKELRGVLDVNRLYIREYFVYSKMLPMLEELQILHNIPKEERFNRVKFYRGITEEYKETLIMEDLIESGFQMYDRFKSFDRNHLALCIKTLARYHATSFVLKEKCPDKYAECLDYVSIPSQFGNGLKTLLTKNKNIVLKLIEEEKYRNKINYVLENIYNEVKRCLEPENSAPYNVLCHGDCWSNNILFKYQGKNVEEVRFVDWQILREASPVTDIVYLIFTGTDRKTRKECYEDMLDLYYATLSSNVTKMGVDISKCYPESVYRQHLKEYVVYGLIMCIGALPITQSNKGEAPELINMIDENAQPSCTFSESTNIKLKEVIEDYVDYGLI